MSELLQNYDKPIKSLFPLNNKYAFLVGAGISMNPPTNLPSAVEIMSSVLEFSAPLEEQNKLSQLKDLRFEWIIEKSALFNADVEYLDYFMLIKKFNLIHLFLAYLIREGHYVFTTNFDYLIETALQYLTPGEKHSKIYPVIMESDFQLFKEADAKIKDGYLPLFKLHGSKYNIITGENTLSSVISKIKDFGKQREIGQLFSIDAYKKILLNNVLKQKTLIVLGYSGNDDFDITPTLKELTGLSRIIWIEHARNPEQSPLCVKINPNRSAKMQKSGDPHINLLIELQKTINCEIFRITAPTAHFIGNYLIPYLIRADTTLQIFEQQVRENVQTHSSQIPKFREWIIPKFSDISFLSKYRFVLELYLKARDYESVIRCANQGIKLADKEGLELYKPHFWNAIGQVHSIQGDYKEMIELYEKICAFTRDKDEMTLFPALVSLGTAYVQQKQWNLALERLTEAQQVADDTLYLPYQAQVTIALGQLYQSTGDIPRATQSYLKGVEITKKTGEIELRAVFLNNLGTIYLLQNQFDPAEAYFKEAYQIADLLNDYNNLPNILTNLANIEINTGRISDAKQKLEKALMVTKSTNNEFLQAQTMNYLGALELRQGFNEKAKPYLIQAHELANKSGNTDTELQAIVLLGKIEEVKVNYGEALNKYKIALKIARDTQNILNVGFILEFIAAVLGAMGQFSEAIDHLEEAKKIAINLNNQERVKFYSDLINQFKQTAKDQGKKPK